MPSHCPQALCICHQLTSSLTLWQIHSGTMAVPLPHLIFALVIFFFLLLLTFIIFVVVLFPVADDAAATQDVIDRKCQKTFFVASRRQVRRRGQQLTLQVFAQERHYYQTKVNDVTTTICNFKAASVFPTSERVSFWFDEPK